MNLLMHSNTIGLSAVHSIIILVGPIQPGLDKPLQIGVIPLNCLPSRHERLKSWDGATQDWVTLRGHHLLYDMRNLLIRLQS